jgi:hypothetical protein
MQRADDYPFFGITRNVALARAITASSAFTRHCAKQIVLPVLITSVSTVAHGLVRQCGNQPAMDEAARVGVRLGQPEPQDDRIRGFPGIDRLPRIGQRTRPGLGLKTFGDAGGVHV